jgi:hypothetical protein
MNNTIPLLRRRAAKLTLAFALIAAPLTLFALNGTASATTTSATCSLTLSGTIPTTNHIWPTYDNNVSFTATCSWSGTAGGNTEFDAYSNGYSFIFDIAFPTANGTNTTFQSPPPGTYTGEFVQCTYPGGTAGCIAPTDKAGNIDSYSRSSINNPIFDTNGGTNIIAYSQITNSFGVPTPCTVTSQSGFAPATGDGITSFDYKYTYTGTADVIIGAPKDSTTATTTNNGKTFPANSTIITAPPTSQLTISVTPALGGDPNASEFWCYSTSTGWVDWGNAYSGGSGSGPSILGCSLTSVTGAVDISTSRDIEYNFYFSSSAQSAVVLQMNPDPGLSTLPTNYSASNTINTKTFTTDFFNTTTASNKSVILDANLTSRTNTTAIGAEAWCYSTSTTTWFDLGSINALVGHVIGTVQGDSTGSAIIDCSTFPSISIGFNVGTDLANTARWTVCATKWLLIPTAWSKVLPTGLNGKPPFLWVSDATAGITTMYNGITSSLASNKCAGPQVQPFHSFTAGIFATNSTIHNFTIALPSPASVGCAATSTNQNAGEIFGARAWIRAVELFGLTLAFMATIWRLLPWSHNSDAEIIERFGGLNLDGDYIDTRQTNEGSD